MVDNDGPYTLYDIRTDSIASDDLKFYVRNLPPDVKPSWVVLSNHNNNEDKRLFHIEKYEPRIFRSTRAQEYYYKPDTGLVYIFLVKNELRPNTRYDIMIHFSDGSTVFKERAFRNGVLGGTWFLALAALVMLALWLLGWGYFWLIAQVTTHTPYY